MTPEQWDSWRAQKRRAMELAATDPENPTNKAYQAHREEWEALHAEISGKRIAIDGDI